MAEEQIFTVRRAALADMPAVGRVYSETWKKGYKGLISQDYLNTLSPKRWAARYEGMGALPETPVQFVAEKNGEIVGICTCGPCRDEGAPPCRGEVYSLYMLPAFWRMGGGARLLAAATGYLKSAGFSHYTLWVLRGNARALAFYRRHGLRPDGALLHTDIGGQDTVEERLYAALPGAGSRG